MRTFETRITGGNLRNSHIYITPFIKELPADAFGGSTIEQRAARLIHLEFGKLSCETDVPEGRQFFRNREFATSFYERTRASEGDTIIFEEVDPYRFRLSLRWPCGAILSYR